MKQTCIGAADKFLAFLWGKTEEAKSQIPYLRGLAKLGIDLIQAKVNIQLLLFDCNVNIVNNLLKCLNLPQVAADPSVS